MKKYLLFGLIYICITVVGLVVYSAYVPHLLLGDSWNIMPHAGIAESYRELGAFDVVVGTKRQWWREDSIRLMGGVVPVDQPRTKVSAGYRSTEDQCKYILYYKVWHIEKHEKQSEKPVFQIEFDIRKGVVKLLNTGEELPFSKERVFTVFLNEKYLPEKFVAIDPSQELTGVNPKLATEFRSLMSETNKEEK